MIQRSLVRAARADAAALDRRPAAASRRPCAGSTSIPASSATRCSSPPPRGVRATSGLPDLARFISFGASPRGPISLIHAARGLAVVRGRDYVLVQDLQELDQGCAPPPARALVRGARRAAQPRQPARRDHRRRSRPAARPLATARRDRRPPPSRADPGRPGPGPDAGAAPAGPRPDDRAPGRGAAAGRSPLVPARPRQRARADPPLRAGRGRCSPDRLERDRANGHAARADPPRRARARHLARARHVAVDDLRHGRAPQGRRRRGRRARHRLRRDPARQPPRARHLRRRAAAAHCRRDRDGQACSACCSRCARRRQPSGRAKRHGATSVGEALQRVGNLARQRAYVVVVSDFRGPRDWRRPLLEPRRSPPRRGRRDPRRARAGAAASSASCSLVDPETGRQLQGRHVERAAAVASSLPRPHRSAREVAAELASAGARHVVLDDAWRLAARARPASSATRERDELRLAPGPARAAPRARRGGRLRLVPAPARARVRRGSSSPALLPNIVDRVPGWRRHLPAAILLLLAVTAFLVGFARPHATISVRSEEATAILAIDTSRSMGATDVPPTRLAAAQASARRFLADLPEQVPRRGRRLQLARAGRRPADARPRVRRRGDRHAPHRRGHGARRRGRDRRRRRRRDDRRAARKPRGEKPAPAVILVLSDGAVDGGRDRARPRRSGARGGEGARVHGAARHRGRRRAGAAGRRLRRADPGAARPRRAAPRRRRRRAAASSQAPTARRISARCTPTSSRGSAARDKDEEITVAFAARVDPAAPRGWRPLAALVQEGPVIRIALAARSPWPRRSRVACIRRAAPRTSATGSWSAFPSPGPGSRFRRPAASLPTTSWRLVCPQGVVGGVDARVSEAAVAVEFPGRLGSPVNPGDHDDPLARLHGDVRRARRQGDELPAVHRLHPRRRAAGRARRPCMPPPSAVKPGEPITTRVTTLRVVAGTLAAEVGHLPPRRAPAAARATASGSTPTSVPSAAELAAVRVVRAVRGGTDPRQRDAARTAGRSPRRGAGTRGVCPVRFDWPLMLLALLIVPLAVVSPTWRSSGGAPGTRSTSRTSRCSPRWRPAAPAGGASSRRCSRARADLRARRARPARDQDVRRQRAGVDRAHRRRLGLDGRRGREADAARGGAGGDPALPRRLPGKYRVGLVTFSGEPFVAAPLTHDRQLVLDVAALRLDLRPGNRDRRRARALGRAPPACRDRTATAPARPTRRCAASDPDAAAVGDPPPLGRRADAGHARAARGRGAREVVRHPRLHGRPRHAERRSSTAAASSGPSRPTR